MSKQLNINNKGKVLFKLSGLVLIIGLFANGLKAQEVFQPYKTNAVPYHGYLYPVIPGTEEWIALGGYEERLASVQLPADTLQSISTARLLESCLYNPFIIDIFAFDDQVQQMGRERNYLNCLDEYYNRPDCLSELVSLYSSRQVTFIFDISECDENQCDRGRYQIDYDIMEVMMAYMNTIMDFSSNEIKDVVSALLDKTTRWEQYFDTYHVAHKREVLLLMGRLLNKVSAFSDYQGTTLSWFLENGYCMDASSCESDMDYIMQVARRYTDIEENVFMPGVIVIPNPTDGFVKIEGNEVERVEVYNVLGQLVKETKENILDLSDQEAGTYIIKVITESGILTKQIIKK